MRLDRWLKYCPCLTDGAWGTEFQQQGLVAGECPDHWNIAFPDKVLNVARSYVNAGSQIILTNTFRSNRITLAGHGLADQVEILNGQGVALSRQAASDRAAVFASIGPTGKMLMMGETSEDEMMAAFTEQSEALVNAGADALILETMTDLAEAKIALAAARRAGIPVIVSFVFDSGKQKDRTMMGATPEQVAQEITDAGADALGANCGLGISGFIPLCRRLKAATSLPIWIKANAGLPEIVEGKPFYRMSPQEFASFVPALVEAGASFIGGCCGTNPSFISCCSAVLKGDSYR